MAIRSSAKSICAHSQNLSIFMAGMMRMHRDLVLARARTETNPTVKGIQIHSARSAHHAYLSYLRQS